MNQKMSGLQEKKNKMKVCPNRLSLLSLGISVKCHSLNLSPVLAYGFGGGGLQSF